MRFFVILALLSIMAAIANAAQCHPLCKWQCDDPECPAQCHPVCERPKCQMECEEPECPQCTIHCERPACSVRCPKDMCEKEDCPKCETVCEAPKCHTQCIAPQPVCVPKCEETACNWKCKKPTLCPKPKCELQCEKPACEEAAQPTTPRGPGANGCCQCNEPNVVNAIELADKASPIADDAMKPSFMEVLHSIKFKDSNQADGSSSCCPCGAVTQ